MDEILPLDDEKAERLLIEAAIEKARRDPRPSIPHEIIQAKLVKKMAELELKIAALADK